MKPGPAYITEIILSELALDAQPEALEDIIYKIVRDHDEWGLIPEEKAPLWSNDIKKRLSFHLKQCNALSKQPRFVFNSSSDYKIQGACFIEPCDLDIVKEQKLRRLRWKEYYDYLKSVTPDVFELICAQILGLLAVPNPILTPYRADQGIDFFGKMSIGDLTGHGPLFPVFETDLIFWLVGQAKHYPDSKISTPDIRALAGSAFLGRAKVFPKVGALPQLSIRACDPVIMLFFTTGQISRDGWSLCQQGGIIAMDGEMLAAFLADKQVGIDIEGEKRSFNAKKFEEWLGIKGK